VGAASATAAVVVGASAAASGAVDIIDVDSRRGGAMGCVERARRGVTVSVFAATTTTRRDGREARRYIGC